MYSFTVKNLQIGIIDHYVLLKSIAGQAYQGVHLKALSSTLPKRLNFIKHSVSILNKAHLAPVKMDSNLLVRWPESLNP